MTIDLAQVQKVAHLARLALTPEEEQLYTTQLNSILGYVEQLSELDVSGVEPTFRPVDTVNVVRADEHRPVPNRDELLGCAPEQEGDFFRVPQILNEE
jgi:aspartyl-tRNA(Asn)/glutamyl-tRNA(Gln) amidotransferase subunit C